MKDVERKLLYELVKNSRRSDRELSKKLGVSQPSVSRLIARLRKDIDISFTANVDLGKAGFQILAVTYGKKTGRPLDAVKINELLDRFRNCIIFASTGLGSGIDADRMVVSVHKDYSDYFGFREYLRAQWNGIVTVGSSFVVSLKADKIIKQFSTIDLFTSKYGEETKVS